MVKSLMRHSLVWGLIFGLYAPICAAQAAPDNILQSYTLATESLNESLTQLPVDGALSREALDRALQTLRPLSRDTSSTTLISALENTFGRAATAIQNESQTDLTVQIAVLKGGIQRLVYESALQAANDDDLDLSRERLNAIATDMNFSERALASLDIADSFPRLIASFDAGAAAAVQQAVGRASESRESTEVAYESLASAYGTFLPVQDSPRVAANVNEQFTLAFQTLLAQNNEAFGLALSDLAQTMTAFETAAQDALAGNDPIDVPAAPTAEAAASDPATDTSAGVAASPDAAGPATVAPVATNPDNAATGAEAPNVPESGIDAPVDVDTTDAPVAPPTITADAVQAAEQDLRRGELLTAFTDLGVTTAQQEQLVNTYLDNGFSTVDDALDTLYVSSSRALVAIETGDQKAARNHIDTYQATYERFVSPLLANNTTSVGLDTQRLAASLSSSPSLRLQDAAVLVGNVNAVAGALEGIVPTPTHELLVSTSLVWSGWVRLLSTLVLGILAFIPLRLLNLAFGGANRNWRFIGVALFLLLLPIMYEGLSALAALLANLLNLDVLNALSAFSIFQNTLSQVIWVVVTALAIFLAIAGLYGICVQFGLLGPRNPNETIISTQEMTGPVGETSPDWDEEF